MELGNRKSGSSLTKHSWKTKPEESELQVVPSAEPTTTVKTNVPNANNDNHGKLPSSKDHKNEKVNSGQNNIQNLPKQENKAKDKDKDSKDSEAQSAKSKQEQKRQHERKERREDAFRKDRRVKKERASGFVPGTA
jgi:hypothetical protein